MMDSIAAASMSMSQAEFESAYDIALMKRSMDAQMQQAETLINEMLASVPAPGGRGVDIYG